MGKRFRVTRIIAMLLVVGLLATTGLQAAKNAPRMIPDNFSTLAEPQRRGGEHPGGEDVRASPACGMPFQATPSGRTLQGVFRRPGRSPTRTQAGRPGDRLHHRQDRLHHHQQPRGRERRQDQGRAQGRARVQGRDRRPRSADRPRADQGRGQGRSAGGAPRQLSGAEGRRVGGGHRQPLRPRAHGHRRHRQRQGPGDRLRALRRLHPDRRLHQPRQQRRAAA